MAAKTGTYTLIASNTVSDTSTNSITFSSIPSTYIDLVLVFNGARNAAGTSYIGLRFNSDTATNYSLTTLFSNTASTGSNRYTSQNNMWTEEGDPVTEVFNNKIISIMDYSNSNTYKTALIRSNNAGREVTAAVGLWRSTSVISSITATLYGGATPPFAPGSTFKLYGIEAGNL